jgi:hypothetical protein
MTKKTCISLKQDLYTDVAYFAELYNISFSAAISMLVTMAIKSGDLKDKFKLMVDFKVK